jgi:hypothetical protein
MQHLILHWPFLIDVVTFSSVQGFYNLVSDLPAPKLALSCSGGDIASKVARSLRYGFELKCVTSCSTFERLLPQFFFVFLFFRFQAAIFVFFAALGPRWLCTAPRAREASKYLLRSPMESVSRDSGSTSTTSSSSYHFFFNA